MRMQIEGSSIRFRVDEAELAALLDGWSVEDVTALPDGRMFTRRVRLDVRPAFLACEPLEWNLSLPLTEVAGLARALPCRDGIGFELETAQGTLTIRFDVDVRDSVRMRRPSPRTRGD